MSWVGLSTLLLAGLGCWGWKQTLSSPESLNLMLFSASKTLLDLERSLSIPLGIRHLINGGKPCSWFSWLLSFTADTPWLPPFPQRKLLVAGGRGQTSVSWGWGKFDFVFLDK